MASRKRNVGILGGSFDPIHFGHIKPSLELAQVYQLEHIRLLPCKLSPFKEQTHANAKHRWNMVKLIADGSDVFVADARELERETPSYTYTSLLELTQELGEQYKLFWCLGADALEEFPAWYKADEIMRLAHVLVLGRPGYELPQNKEISAWLDKYLCADRQELESSDYGCIYQTETQMLDISSTQIRTMIHNGEQPKYLIPGGVWNYIKRNRLYMDSQDEQI